MKKVLVSLLAAAAMAGAAGASQAQVLVNLSSLVTITGETAGSSTLVVAPPNPTLSTNANALNPGTDFTVGGFTSTSGETVGTTPEAATTVAVTLTGVSFPGTGTFTAPTIFVRATLNATQSNNTVYSLSSNGAQVAGGTVLGNLVVGGITYTFSFANNDSIPNPSAVSRGSFSFHVTAPRGVNQVPEPGTYAMLAGSGLGGLLLLRRRRA